MKKANFKVDPRLAALLGESYRSTELAVKELVDNSYDADAEKVWIIFPEPLSGDPITVKDNGSGMTEKEIRNEYLNIANSRMSRKGKFSTKKKRLVKGRKGIGKFAGLMVANQMEVCTIARGTSTTLSIPKNDLAAAKYDLGKVNLPLTTDDCDVKEHGTTITLRSINQNYTFPNPEVLKQVLIVEYGREADFEIYINGELLDIEHIPGQNFEGATNLPHVGEITYRYTIATKSSIKQSGIALRVAGKIIGKPTKFDLDRDDTVAPKLLRRLYGEVVANGLESDVTADWGTVIENSKGLQAIEQYIRPVLKKSLSEVHQREVQRARVSLRKEIEKGLSKVPEHRQPFAKRALNKVLYKFYGETESKLASVISVVLDSFQTSEYWSVFQTIEEAKSGDINNFTDALTEFGRFDIAMMAQQSKNRMAVLDEIEELIQNPKTTALQMYQLFDKNLWLLGLDYALLAANKELKDTVDLYLDKTFPGSKKSYRPELLVARKFDQLLVAIDLRSPSHTINRANEALASQFKDDLKTYFPNNKIEVITIGASFSPVMENKKSRRGIRFLTYQSLVDNSREQINWLLKELKKRV